MYIRHKTNQDGRRYYYVVETVWDGKPKQKTLKYLGTAENVLKVFNEVKEWRSRKTE